MSGFRCGSILARSRLAASLASLVAYAAASPVAGQEAGTPPRVESSQSAPLPAEIAKAFEQTRPSPRESQWQKIRWRTSLSTALAEGKRAGKPVYYFATDGELTTGNC